MLLVLETHDRCWLVAKIDDRKAGRIQAPRGAVLVIGQLEATIARAKRERSPQDRAASPRLTVRPLPSTASAKL